MSPRRLLANAFARAIGVDFRRVQFTPDMLPSDLTGTMTLRAGELAFRPGPVFTNLVLADEINRTPPKTQAALLEAMQERQVSVDGVRPAAARAVPRRRDPEPDRVRRHLPAARGAARPLPRQARRRVPERRPTKRRCCGSRTTGSRRPPSTTCRPSRRRPSCSRLRDLVDATTVAEPIIGYVVALVRRTRELPSVALGASPRAAVHLLAAAKAAARLAGRGLRDPRRRRRGRAGSPAAPDHAPPRGRARALPRRRRRRGRDLVGARSPMTPTPRVRVRAARGRVRRARGSGRGVDHARVAVVVGATIVDVVARAPPAARTPDGAAHALARRPGIAARRDRRRHAGPGRDPPGPAARLRRSTRRSARRRARRAARRAPARRAPSAARRPRRCRGPLGLGRCTFDGDGEAAAARVPRRRRRAAVRRRAPAGASSAIPGLRARGPLGLGTDFESIRDYLPDDDVRQINWTASDRVGRPMSNVYRIEQDRDVVCLLDAGRLYGRAPLDAAHAPALDAAVDAVTMVALVADELGDRCGVTVFDSDVRAPARAAPQRRRARSCARSSTWSRRASTATTTSRSGAIERRQARAHPRVHRSRRRRSAARSLVARSRCSRAGTRSIVASVRDPDLDAPLRSARQRRHATCTQSAVAHRRARANAQRVVDAAGARGRDGGRGARRRARRGVRARLPPAQSAGAAVATARRGRAAPEHQAPIDRAEAEADDQHDGESLARGREESLDQTRDDEPRPRCRAPSRPRRALRCAARRMRGRVPGSTIADAMPQSRRARDRRCS